MPLSTPRLLPLLRARRCFQLFHFVSICVRAVYLQEVAHRAHFLAMREAEAQVQRYGSFLRLLLPAKTVRVRGRARAEPPPSPGPQHLLP